MSHRDILNIECCVKSIESARPELDKEVEKWLRCDFAVLETQTRISPSVDFINVIDLVQRRGNTRSEVGVLLADVELHIHVFELHNQPEIDLEECPGDDSQENGGHEETQEREQSRASVTLLPHLEFQDLWDSLIFDNALHNKLLRFLLRMSMQTGQLASRMRSFNRLVLLYGPPGTGKSTLCRAIAQKLAIRLRRQYEAMKLLEIDAATLFSKFFGESSKLVSRIFDKIERMLEQEPRVFLCVLVDEIESLATSRQQSVGANEPRDSMRDQAFLDRIDIKQYIPEPSTRIRYEIFRKCLLDLLDCKIIISTQGNSKLQEDVLGGPAEEISLVDEYVHIHSEGQDRETFPPFDAMQLNFRAREDSAPYKLWRIAEKSAGLSGRVLQRLPTQALAMHIAFDPCLINEALDALAQAVDEQQLASFNPTQIFADDVTEEKGENARLSAFVGAIAVGDLVKSTLGPKGMDKILQSASTGEIMVTNDGATILKSIALDNAAAKVLVNISKVQDDEVGDGTTSVAVLAAELLREAEKLVERKLHPQTIIEGYRIASNVALEALAKTAQDHSEDKEAFRKDLLAIARTTLSSKVLSQDRDHFASLACDAVLRLRGSTDLSHIQIIKKAGGKLNDSYLDEGFILDKRIGVNQPKRLENAKILVANTAMDTDKVKIFGARVKVDSTGGLAKLEEAEREKMKQKVEKIKAHGINCFVNRQLIYNRPEQLFSDAGIISIEHADFDGIERLALVTGGEIASTFDHPDMVKLGHCNLIEEVMIGEDTLIKFSGVAAGEACTIVLRGATEQLLDEADRSLHDALAVLSQTVREPKTTLGGGCAEMVMAKAVEQEAPNVAGKKAMAVDAFAAALRQLPTILADNAGIDSSDLIARLKKEIYNGQTSSGLDLLIPGGGIADMREKGVIESYKLKRAVVSSAAEAAELLLRVDSIVRCAPRKRERM
ncbi:MAG: hypothetical protein Q9201_001157 [Fulgogasparrea decipioides]